MTDRKFKDDADTGLSRRSLLRGVTLAVGGATVLATISAQPAEAKMAQAAAGYQTTPKDGKQCSGCSLFQAPASCKLIDGAIAPTGYCRFFVKKS